MKGHAPGGELAALPETHHTARSVRLQRHPDNREPTLIFWRRPGPVNVVSRMVVTGALADRLDGPFGSPWRPI
jgi:hypothetical protein